MPGMSLMLIHITSNYGTDVPTNFIGYSNYCLYQLKKNPIRIFRSVSF